MRLRAIADELVLALPDLLADAERLHTLRQEWRRAKAKPGQAAGLGEPRRREMEALAGSTASRVRSVAVALVGTLADAAAAARFHAPTLASVHRLVTAADAAGDLGEIAFACEALRGSPDLPDVLRMLGFQPHMPIAIEIARALEALAIVGHTCATDDYVFRRPRAAA